MRGGRRNGAGRPRLPDAVLEIRGTWRADRHGPKPPPPAPEAVPSPSWRWLLMTGSPAQCRLRGWVALTYDDCATVGRRLWAEHGDALTREAAAAGFVPFWSRRKKPRGPAFDAWAAAFLQAHRY